jgi:methionyl-tRNA formyltransferase
VFAPPDVAGRADPVKAKALDLGLPLSQPASFRGEAAYDQFRSLDADLIVMAFATLIVPERILYAPRFKSICFHPSLLPRHRGASAINWAIIQGDVETGVTWFWPDKGIDTGPILLQQRIAIGPNDTTGALYFNTLFPLGIETMCDAIDLIKAGKAPMIAQDEKLATYEPPCRDEHAKVDFRKSARDIYNVIRGCDPQPGAYALMAGRQLRLYDATIENAKPNAPPGTIVSVDDGGMRLALSDAALLIRRVRFDPSTKKVAPSELVGVGELTVSAGLE